MNRRGFFQRLSGVAAAAAIPVAPAVTKVVRSMDGWPTVHQPLVRGTHEIHWTGWKASQEHNWLVGQWIAWPRRVGPGPNGRLTVPFLYVNVPGFIGGPYRPGNVFHLGSRTRLVMLDASDDTLGKYIEEGRGYIIQLADAFCGDHPESIGYGLYEFPVPDLRPVRI